MSRSEAPSDDPPDDTDLARLQALLDAVPPPLQPMDVSAVDGFLCGVLSQPEVPPASAWLRWVGDVEGRPLARSFDATALHTLVQRRLDRLRRAIDGRQWFDPWVFELDGDATPSECVRPWVAGFAAAMEHLPALTRLDDARLLEPMALLYRHFEPDDLEDAEALLALVDELEPVTDLAEAVQDLVTSVMLIADVVRPLQAAAHVDGRRPRRRR